VKEKDIKRCKYDKDSKCVYTQNFGKEEPDLVDCLLCSAASYASIATTFMRILATEGAGRFGKDFLESVVEMGHAQKLRVVILKKERPEYIEIIKKRARSKGVMVLTPEDIPEGFRAAFEEYQKRGDRMRI